MQDMSEQAKIMEKCLEGSGRKRIKEMDNEDKICILLFNMGKKWRAKMKLFEEVKFNCFKLFKFLLYFVFLFLFVCSVLLSLKGREKV